MGSKSMSTLRTPVAPIARFLLLTVSIITLTTCDLFKAGLGSKIDVSTPTVDVSSLKNGDYINSARTLSGTASDDVQVKSVDVAVYSGSTLVSTLKASVSGSSWSVVLDPAVLFPNQETQADLVIQVSDDSGKTTERRLVLYFDTVKPTISSLNPSMENLAKTDNYLSEIVAFEGSVKDGFGVQAVSFLAGGVELWDSSRGTSTWTLYSDTTTYAAGTGGVTNVGGSVLKVPVAIVATDKAGNASDPTTGYFFVDQERSAPWIYEPVTGFFTKAYSSGSTTILAPEEQLTFKISDAECIDADTIEVSISDPSGTLATPFEYSIADGNMTLTKLQEDGERLLKAEIAITLPPAASLSPKGLGEYALGITAADDVAYKQSLPAKPAAAVTRSYSSISLTISNAVPTVSVTSPANGAIVKALSMSGTIEDGIGVASVSVGIDGAAGTAATLASSGTGVLSSSWTFAPSTALTEGTYTIDVYGFNVGAKQSAVTQRQVVVDTTAPSLEILSVAPATTDSSLRPTAFADVTSAGDPGDVYNKVNGVARIRLSATDQNPLQSVTWQLKSLDGTVPIVAETAISGWIVDIDTTSADLGLGLALDDETKYRLILTATDKAGNSTTSLRTLWVSRSGDEPTFTLKNMTALATTPASASSNLMLSNPRIETSVMDDDWVDSSSIALLIDQAPTDASPLWIALSGTRSSDGSVSASYSLSSLSDDRHYVYLRASDTDVNGTDGRKAGLSSASGVIGPVYFAIDLTPPAIVFDGATEGLYVSSTKALSGTVSSGLALDSSAPLTFSFNGGAAAAPSTLSPAASSSGSHAWTYNLDVGSVADGSRTLVATALDEFGVSTTRSLAVTVDKTVPEVSVTNAALYFSDVNGLSLVGTTRDITSGVASMIATVMLGATDVTSQTSLTLNAAAGTPNTLSNWSLDLSALATGTYSVSLRAVDKASNANDVAAFTVNVDKDTPVVSIDSVLGSPVAGAVYNAASAMPASWSGTATETFFSSGTVTLGVTTIGTLSSAGAWTATNTWSSVSQGSHTLTVRVTDLGGHSASATATFTKDTIAPTLSVTTPEDDSWQSTTPLTIRGGVDDGSGMGVDTVYYLAADSAANHSTDTTSVITSTWTAASGTGSWNGTLNLSTLGEGSRNLWVAALDKAGNWTSPAATSFSIDLAKPRATMSATGTFVAISTVQSTRLAFTLSGTADDAQVTTGRAATSSLLSYTKDGGTATEVTLTPAADGSWSWSDATIANGSNDGLYIFTLTVTDAASKTNTSQQIIKVDTTVPTLVISAPVAGEATVGPTSYSISGTSRDTGGVGFDGTADVEYQFSTEGTTWHSLSLTGTSWSDSAALGAGQGSRTLNVRSTDALGNQATASVLFYFDTANPTLTETLVGTTDTQYRNADRTFSGKASDTNALSSLAVSINGGTGVDIAVDANGLDDIAGNIDDNSWTYVFDADSPTAEGNYTLVFTATDAANKTTSLTRTVLVDRTAPTLDDITDLRSTWHTSASLAVSGTASDGSGSGLSLVEYSTDGTSYSAFTGTLTFGGTVSFSDGSGNALRIRAVDKAGNASTPAIGDLSLQTVQVDTVDPIVEEITDPDTTPIINGTQELSISLKVTDATSGPATAQAKVGDSDFTTGTIYSASATSGAATINVADLSSLEEGSRRVYVRVLDVAVRPSTPVAVNVLVDKSPPTVIFSSHVDGATINKSATFSGTSSDTNGIASCVIQVYHYSGTAWEWIAAPSGAAGASATSWSHAAFNTAAITADSSAYDSNTVTTGLQLRVRARATDEAGNYADAERTLLVDQNADKPIIKLTNLTTTGTPTLKQTKTIYGSLTDDDGTATISTFNYPQLSIKNSLGASWTTVTLEGSSFSYDVAGDDGDKELYFMVVDAAQTTFTTTASSTDLSPRLYQGVNTYLETPLTFKLDTKEPEIESDSIQIMVSGASAYSDYSSASANYGGSATGTFMVRFDASDANGIASASVTVTDSASATSKQDATLVDGHWTTGGYLNVTGLANGSATLSMTAIDSSGLSRTLSKSITIDNAKPTFGGISSPASGTIVNGNVTLNGSCSDTGVGLKSVSYQLGIGASVDPESASWIDLGAASPYAWQLTLNTDTYANTTYSTYNSVNETYYFPIIFKVADNAGNTTVTALGSYYLTINPNADRPTVDIIYPVASDSPLGGSVRVYGTAEDDDAVYATFMQIDVNNDGYYTSLDTVTADFDNDSGTDNTTIDWCNGDLGQQITGTNNWSQKINTAGEFNPTGANESRTIHVRVRALDKTGNTSGNPAAVYGPWVETTITFDNNTPKIGSSLNLYLYQGSVASPTATRVYTEGMYASGDWVFGGSVEDETALEGIEITSDSESALDLSANLTIASDGTVSGTNSGWINMQTAAKRYDLQIPLNTSSLGSTSGVVKFTVKAMDTERTTTTNVTIYFDNRAPFTTLTTTGPVVNTDGFFDVAGSAVDVGSSISKIELYFVRPYLGGATVNGSQYLGYNRFYNPATGVSSGSSWTADNVEIQAVDGADYGADGSGTVSIDTFYYPASSAYIISVDHLGYTEYWNGSVIQNNDSDAFVEKLVLSAGRYSWSGTFDSSLMPDGPIQIHYLVYDSAGNKTHYQLDTVIKNRGLSVGSVTLGTDLDGSGAVTSGEQSTFTGWTATGFSFKAAPATFDIATTGGNGSLYYVLGASNGTGDTIAKSGTLRTGQSGLSQQISLSSDDFTGFDDGAATFTIAIYDSMEETEYPDSDSLAYNDSLSSTAAVGAIVALTDTSRPTSHIRPFHWNGYATVGSTDDNINSLFENLPSNGHIDIASNSSNGTGDPDVSGKISVRGSAYDDQRLTAVYAYIGDGSSAAGSFAFTGCTTATIGGLTYYQVGTYSGGVWAPSGDSALSTSAWYFTASNVGIDQTGHRIEWRLDWNSAAITGGAAENTQIMIAVGDKTSGQYSSTTVVSSVASGTADTRTISTLVDDALKPVGVKVGDLVVFGSGCNTYVDRVKAFDDDSGTITLSVGVDASITAYTIYLDAQNTPSYSVDVVPYIISISDASATDNRSPFGGTRLTNVAVNSGKAGYYAFYQCAVGVILTGFNLLGSTATDSNNQVLIGSSEPEVTNADSNRTSMTLTLPTLLNTLANGAGLVVTTNNVDSINNVNTNTLAYNQVGEETTVFDDRLIYVDETAPTLSVAAFGRKYNANAGVDDATNGEKTLGYVDHYYENIAYTTASDRTTWQGHVEYADDSEYNETTADVSGWIVFKGKAMDNQRISKITVAIGNSTTGFDGGNGVGAAFTIYESSTTAAGVTSGAFLNGTGWQASSDGTDYVIDSTRTTRGHVLNWNLAWNSALLSVNSGATFGAEQAVSVVFTAYDANNSTTQHYSAAADGTMTVDVVPYITGISRTDYNTNRSRYGAYPVQMGETSITLSGFNLPTTAASAIRTQATANKGTSTFSSTFSANSVTPTNYTIGSNTIPVATAMTITAPSVSGYLSVVNNGIQSINNLNADNANEGNYADTGTAFADRQHYYNREVVSTDTGSLDWTDDRYLSMWDVDKYIAGTTTTQIEYPAMSMDNTGTLYGSWVDYSNARVWYNTVNGTLASTSPYYNGYDPPEYSDLYVDPSQTENYVTNGLAMAMVPNNLGSGGVWYLSGTMNMSNNGGIAVYTASAPSLALEGSTTLMGQYYGIEGMGNDMQLKQFQRPKIVRNGSAIHTVYWDQKNKSLKYVYIANGSSGNNMSERQWIVLDGKSDGQDRVFTNYSRVTTSVPAASSGSFTLSDTSTTFSSLSPALKNGMTVTIDTGSSRPILGRITNVGTNQLTCDYLLAGVGLYSSAGTASARAYTIHRSVINGGLIVTSAFGSSLTYASTTITATLGGTTLKDSKFAAFASGAYADIAVGNAITLRGDNMAQTTSITDVNSSTNTLTLADALTITPTAYTIYTGTSSKVAQGLTASSAVSEYASIDVDSSGNPIVLYYDSTAGLLKMVKASTSSPSAIGNWTRYSVSSTKYLGQYVSMKIDSAGTIHAAAYQNSTGKLVYIKGVTTTDTTTYPSGYIFTETDVDTGGVGFWADITVKGTTPYISYINNGMVGSFDGLKCAYLDTTKGGWEYLVVPADADHVPTLERTSIEVSQSGTDSHGGTGFTWADGTNNFSWGQIAIGYRSDRFELVYKKGE